MSKALPLPSWNGLFFVRAKRGWVVIVIDYFANDIVWNGIKAKVLATASNKQII